MKNPLNHIRSLIAPIVNYFIDQNKSASFRKEVKESEEDLDFENVFNSMGLAGNLYDQLKRKVHPDREMQESKKVIATELAQLISENKRDYNKLVELKNRAIEELNIEFL
jgi:hypothetical protein